MEAEPGELTCWMRPLVKSGSLLMICLMVQLRDSPTRALQASARIWSASVMGTFRASSDSSTWACTRARVSCWCVHVIRSHSP